jgi:hypothetical protein
MGRDKSEILISVQGGTAKTVIGLDDLKQALNLFGVVDRALMEWATDQTKSRSSSSVTVNELPQ